MTNELRTTNRRPTRPPKPKGRRGKGWTPERRARQAALIRFWQPWRRSTGPKTEAGKARCAMNFARRTRLSEAQLLRFRRAREVLRAAARNLKAVRAYLRTATLSPNGEAIRRSRYDMEQPTLSRSRP
jgi:hypothetical protein